jgi:hypothetical protein
MLKPQAGTAGVDGEVTFHLRLITTTSGAVSSTSWTPAGVTIAKTGSETGRYTITLPGTYRRLINVIATPIGADDAAWGAVATGLLSFVRDDDIATDGTVEVQFASADTNFADAELPDGRSVMLTIIVDRGP